jgi:hypothetical protein
VSPPPTQLDGIADSVTTGQPNSPPVPPGFTFVNQHEDVQSVLDRRIHNESHRHEIRSHVMRGVRQHEHTLGKRRPTGRRPPARTRSTEGSLVGTRRSSLRDSPASLSRQGSNSTDGLSQPASDALVKTRLHPTPSLPPPLYVSPSAHFLDPFAATPGGNLRPADVDLLFKYSISTFLPMSFPVERAKTEREARVSMLLNVKVNSYAAYLGFLATVAAHRAVLYGHHRDLSPSARPSAESISDPLYRNVLQCAINATRQKQDKRELDGEYLEACFGLIGAETIVGDFQKARSLLLYVSQRVLHSVDIPIEARAWVPMVDMKTALGTLSMPIIKVLPWMKVPVPPEVMRRIRPPSNCQLSMLGRSFANVTHISPRLRQLLADAVIVCQFCEFNASNDAGLEGHEHIMYRCKTHELEHELLCYVHDAFPQADNKSSLVVVPPLEQVVRLALMGMLSDIASVVHPGTGLGRATTTHQMKALATYGTRLNPDMDRAELKILVWVLFAFASRAREQPEAPELEHLLIQACTWLGLTSWNSMEMLLLGCLYIPSVQGRFSQNIWARSEQGSFRGRIGYPMVMR